MIKKLVILVCTLGVTAQGLEQEKRFTYLYLPVDLPTDIQQEISQKIFEAITSENIEVAAKKLRTLQGASKAFQTAINNNIEKIIRDLAKTHALSPLLAAQYIGTNSALQWYAANKNLLQKEPSVWDGILEHYSGSPQSKAIVKKLEPQLPFLESNKYQLSNKIMIDTVRFRASGAKIIKMLPNGTSTLLNFNHTIINYLLQAKSDIIAISLKGLPGEKSQISLLKCDTNGKIDKTFGNNGIATITVTILEELKYGLVRKDNSIVLAGITRNNKFILVLLSESGKVLSKIE